MDVADEGCGPRRAAVIGDGFELYKINQRLSGLYLYSIGLAITCTKARQRSWELFGPQKTNPSPIEVADEGCGPGSNDGLCAR